MSPVVWTSYIMILVVIVMFLFYKIFSPDPVGGLRDLFGTMGILAIVLAVGISLILGYFFGGPAEGTRRSLAMGSANRNARDGPAVCYQHFLRGLAIFSQFLWHTSLSRSS